MAQDKETLREAVARAMAASDDKTLVERAVAVPLLERLHRVPPDARLEYEHDPCHHSLFPIGAMCHEAATRIEALEAALRDIKNAVLQGGMTDIVAWQRLVIACQTTAKQALEGE